MSSRTGRGPGWAVWGGTVLAGICAIVAWVGIWRVVHSPSEPAASEVVYTEGPALRGQVRPITGQRCAPLLKPEICASANPEDPAARRAPTDPDRYCGPLTTIDVQDADLLDVLGLLEEVAGVRFEAEPGFDPSKPVTTHLEDVPVDQVIDVVLTTHDVSCERTGEGVFRLHEGGVLGPAA